MRKSIEPHGLLVSLYSSLLANVEIVVQTCDQAGMPGPISGIWRNDLSKAKLLLFIFSLKTYTKISINLIKEILLISLNIVKMANAITEKAKIILSLSLSLWIQNMLAHCKKPKMLVRKERQISSNGVGFFWYYTENMGSTERDAEKWCNFLR